MKGVLVGWIIPAIIAFVPFLVFVRFINKILHERIGQQRALLAYYGVAGRIGLMVEWFIIGLFALEQSRSKSRVLLIFQFGIFSFLGHHCICSPAAS